MTVDCNWCTLRVESDNMQASMCLHAQKGEDQIEVTVESIIAFLKAQTITYGINEESIYRLVHGSFNQFEVVAEGKPATRGEDGYFDFKKNTSDMRYKPIIREDGTADYKNSLSLAIVEEGELIATYIPATDGEPGVNIFNKPVKALGRGKDQVPLRGHGIKIDEAGLNYYASYGGHIVSDGNKFRIEKLYIVSHDLDIDIGNLKFDGDIEIMGDVRSGFSVEATGDIFIHGHVGACTIKAGKNISVGKGVQGKNACTIEAANDIACKFVENCKLIAGGNIYADSLMQSSVRAMGGVYVTSKHGVVISSEVYGMGGVVIKEAGNDAGVTTVLRAGLPKEDYMRVVELTKLIQEADNKIQVFSRHLESIDGQLDNMIDDKIMETRTKIMRAKILLTSQRKDYSDEFDKLSERIKYDGQLSFIDVTGVVHEGVRVHIGTYNYVIQDAVREATFRILNGSILLGPLEEHNIVGFSK